METAATPKATAIKERLESAQENARKKKDSRKPEKGNPCPFVYMKATSYPCRSMKKIKASEPFLARAKGKR